MNAQDYPITTPYGQVAGYPLNNGFHNGIDYGAPEGTPVVVNGVTIGLVGSTGYVTGPHLHVGRWIGGTVTNPGVGGGFDFQNATVTQVASDATNGNYVRIQADGASWVYLHLSKQMVNVGQILKGGTMQDMANDGDVSNIFEAVYALKATADDIKFWLSSPRTFKDLFYGIKDSKRYTTEHFVNDGDIVNLKARGINADGTKGLMWKEATYQMTGGGDITKDAVIKYVQANLK